MGCNGGLKWMSYYIPHVAWLPIYTVNVDKRCLFKSFFRSAVIRRACWLALFTGYDGTVSMSDVRSRKCSWQVNCGYFRNHSDICWSAGQHYYRAACQVSWFWHRNSPSRGLLDITRCCNKTSYSILKQPPGYPEHMTGHETILPARKPSDVSKHGYAC